MKSYDPVAVEKDILRFWKKNKIYEKQKKCYASSKKIWSFIDGPITANNPMGVHHAWGRTLKDLYLRFKAAQRYNIRRQNGYDSQGLWIEVEVERAKGLKSTKDIEEYGIGKFIKACEARTAKMADRITQQSIRLGQWMDWGGNYYTHSYEANDSKWWFIKMCHDKGWLYKGVDVVPWCPRCSAVQSKHALATEGYWDEADHAMFMKFPIAGKKKEYFLVWTTTPWTMAADVAVAAHPDVYYVRAEKDGAIYVLAEKLVKAVLGKNAKVLNRFLGSDLEGMKYVMPYADLLAQKEAVMSGAKPDDPLIPAPHIVVMWDEVSEEDGTGLVHIAPGCGPEDYQLGKAERLPAISPLDEAGRYVEGYDWLSGKLASDMNEKVINDMRQRGFIYKVEKYTHRYPHCTRCKTPVIFRLVPEWYLAMDDLRQPCIKANKTINWVPKYGQKYEETWLNNMGDWLFSRKRYYGLAMPIWECECGHYEVIGSDKELKKKAIKGTFKYFKEHRRPGVDKVLIKCAECGKQARRVVDTVDVWMDAGMVPFYTLKYFKNKKYFNTWFPSDFVTECGPGQYRLWFFMMLMHSVAITSKAPFKNVLTNELVKDERGAEMHKSAGNAIWFDDAAKKVGADVMRWLYSKQDTTKELWFGWGPLKDEYRSLNVLWNFAKYAETNFDMKTKPSKPRSVDAVSRWVLSKLESLKQTVTENLEQLTPHAAALAIEDFYLNVLSRGYGQMIRDNNSAEVKYVLYNSILDTLKLMAPFVPFVTEKIYQEVFTKKGGEQSIHLFEWPTANKKLINKALEAELDMVQEVISTALASRTKMQRGTRWPVKTLTITTKKKAVRDAVNRYALLIKSMTNSDNLKVAASIKGAKLEIKPNYKVLGKKIGAHIKAVAKDLAKAKKVPTYVKAGKKTIKLVQEDLDVREILPKGLIGMRSRYFSTYLDSEETPKMLASGFARELTRKIQDMRKKAKLVKGDKIMLSVTTSIDLSKLAGEIRKKVGAKTLTFGVIKGKHRGKLAVRSKKFEIGFDKC